MACGLPVKMTNSNVGIWLSQLSGVELHAPPFFDRLDHSIQPLLKALIFTQFQNPDYQSLISRHDLHLLFMHFRKKHNSVHLYLIILCYHYYICYVRDRHNFTLMMIFHLPQ